MSRSINEAILYGNVGKEPEVRTLDNGVVVSTFTLATSVGGYKRQDGTDVPEKTSWHNIVCWRKLGEIAEKYIHKGDKILVIGTISYRGYENDKGEKRYVTEIVANDIVLGGKSSGTVPSDSVNDVPADFPPSQPNDDLPF